MTSVTVSGANSALQVGVSYGSIHYSSERSEPRPEPLSTVPYPHDPDFVSRDALDQLHEKAAIPGSRIALVGLGGVGKTQLAIEYARKVREQSSETWVFWIHASNMARCQKSLRDLANRVKIPGREDTANIFQLVGDWLQDGNIGKWILILDNLDDDELLRTSPANSHEGETNSQTGPMQPPLRYLLKCSNGCIIVTSRDRKIALDITGHRNMIAVQQMEKAEALDLLQKKLQLDLSGKTLHTQAEIEDMGQLVDALEFMPLAIVQAAGYIAHRSPRCSVSQYLGKIQGSDGEAVKLLNREARLLYRDWEAKNSILLTWQISFDHIQGTRPSAADLLSLMSFFDRQGIQESVLRFPNPQEVNENSCLEHDEDSSSEEDEDSVSDSDTDQCFEDDITTLSDYSLISVEKHSDSSSIPAREQGAVLTMHRLVQLTVRTWLKTHGKFELWKERFIYNLYMMFPNGRYENWEQCRSLFPHVKSAISQQPQPREPLLQWATLLFMGAWYAHERGSTEDAREMVSKSRKQRVKLLGEADKKALDSTALLASIYRNQARWKEAENLEVQVLEIRKTKLGEDHPNTLKSMGRLASTYRKQGRWKESEILEVQVMETRKIKLGKDHRDTLTSMGNLAVTYWSQGRWKEAEKLEVQVMEKTKVELGDDHPNTLISMSNLASTYHSLGQWKEAEKLEVQVMEISKIKLGEDHPDTLISTGYLASTYHSQGRWKEAEKLEVQVMEKSRIKLGEDHPDTLTSMARLARIWRSLGRNSDAVELLQESLAKQKQILGPNHPDVLRNHERLLEWETEGLNIDA
ncbi:hypothetical protein N7454_004674 [Penicillium verhagenii]|nr:hypothetical protein N7454_004674 [Penicillium verhagenii]